MKSTIDRVFERTTPSPAKGTMAVVLYSFAGGYADALGFLISGSFTGHLTGNLVLLIVELGENRWRAAIRPLIAILTFLAATEAGLRLSAAAPQRSRWFMLWIRCALILLLGLPFVLRSLWYDIALIVVFCFSLGIQNGLITNAGGTTVHTSYLSGTATRLLQFLNKRKATSSGEESTLRGTSLVPSPGFVSFSVIASFFGGAIIAVLANRYLKGAAPLLLCVPLIGAAAATSGLSPTGADARSR